jgi:hypothetical protein
MNLSIFEISVLGVCGGLSLQTVFRAKSNRVVVHVEHGFPLWCAKERDYAIYLVKKGW